MTSKVWDKQIAGSHYKHFKIQPSKFVVENELLLPEGCAIKYICRHRLKGKKQDLVTKASKQINIQVKKILNDR